MGVLISRLGEESLPLHFSIQAFFLSTLDTKQCCLNPKPPWPLADMSLLPSDVGITSVNWVIQSLSSFFNEWEHPRIGCQLPLPCAQFSLVPAAEWWPSISSPPSWHSQELWSACPSCGAGLWHFPATGLWMFRIVCLYFQGYSLKIEGANR